MVGTLPGAKFVAEQKKAARAWREAAGRESGTTSVLLPLSSALLLVAHDAAARGGKRPKERAQAVGKPPAHLQFEGSGEVPAGTSSFINGEFWASCRTVSQRSWLIAVSAVGMRPPSLVSIAGWVRQRQQRHRETWRAAAAGEEGSPPPSCGSAAARPLLRHTPASRPSGFDLIRGGLHSQVFHSSLWKYPSSEVASNEMGRRRAI